MHQDGQLSVYSKITVLIRDTQANDEPFQLFLQKRVSVMYIVLLCHFNTECLIRVPIHFVQFSSRIFNLTQHLLGLRLTVAQVL